jgi:uncharacterized membrane protein YphA (DoxX/SURF4 family)
MTPDPVLTQIVSAALAMLLLIGAWQKLRDVAVFGAALAAYELLPTALVGAVAWTLPMIEAVAGLTLVIDRTRPVGAVLASGLLLVVTAAVIVNLLRGRADLNCGCGGIEDEQTLSWSLVGRNGVLLALVGLCALTPATRTLLWLDYLSVAVGACCLYGLYVMGNQLAANQPRLMRLRSLP